MGTELDSRGVDTRHALWSALALTAVPETVRAVHSDYLDAGARVVTTNTYQATLPALLRAGHDAAAAREIIAAGVRLADEAARRFEAKHPEAQVLIAGGLGPYGAYLADGSEYTGAYDVGIPEDSGFREVHRPRIEVLAGEGVDLFALETIPRLDEAQALVAMVKDLAPQAECWVSFQVRSDGAHLAGGHPLDVFRSGGRLGRGGGDGRRCRRQLCGPRRRRPGAARAACGHRQATGGLSQCR